MTACMKTLSVSVDDFFVDIYFQFDQTVKRREPLKAFEVFTDVENMHVIKHCAYTHPVTSSGGIIHQP